MRIGVPVTVETHRFLKLLKGVGVGPNQGGVIDVVVGYFIKQNPQLLPSEIWKGPELQIKQKKTN